MTRANSQQGQQLARDIRRQFGNGATTRFLHALPTFKVVTDLPEHMRDLLDRLQASESPATDRKR